MPTGSWFEDPTCPCSHERTEGSTLDLHGSGDPIPAERCLDCRAVRLLVSVPELRVVWRAEPLVVRKADFEKRKWSKPSYVPQSWWDSSPLRNA